MLKLPRAVERDARAARIEACLRERTTALNAHDDIPVCTVDSNAAIVTALRTAHASGALVRGLDGAKQALMAQARGLAQADARSGAARGARISRVLVLADDGAQRFYRDAATLLRHHADRLLLVRLRISGDALGAAAVGRAATARALLVTQKDAVAALLLALVAED